MGKKGKNKLPKDERPLNTKARKSDHLRSSGPKPPKMTSTKKYSVSSAIHNISHIDINDEDVDAVLKLLLELEMHEKGFDSMSACVASILRRNEEIGSCDKEVEGEKDVDSESDDESESDSGTSTDSDSDSDIHGDKQSNCEENSNNKSSSKACSDTNTPPVLLPQLQDFVITPAVKKVMRRRLRRDDRRIVNEIKAKENEAKEKEKHIKRERYNREQLKKQQRDGAKSKATPSVVSSARKGSASQDSKLRLQVCSQKNKSSMKLIIIDRDKGWSVEELVGVVRSKLNEPKKYNSLMLLPSKKDFEDGDIRLFDNDTQLCLFVDAKKKHVKPPVHEKKKDQNDVKEEVSSVLPLKSIDLPDMPHTESTEDVDPSEESGKESVNDTDPSLTAETQIDPDIDLYSPICNDENISASMRHDRDAMRAAPRYTEIQRDRTALPMFKAREAFLNQLQASETRTAVVVGDTGCGKTTQVPQILLDDMIDRNKGSEAYIICTQPRRIAAISVAERVAQERLETCGRGVGYQIRLKSKYSQKDTRILFCTTGILLRKMQDMTFLNKVSYIIIDEVHERQVETDFLMAILKSEMSFRHHLQLVLMSATLNSECLRAYMSNCPVVTVPGRLFPVSVHYMDEINAIIKSQQKIHSLGGDARVVREDMLSSSAVTGQKKKKPHKGRASSSSDHKDGVNTSDNILPLFNADTVAEFIIRLIEKENSSASAIGSDSSATVRSVQSIESKAILVFLYGIQPITKVMNILRHRQVLDKLKAKVFVLHSSIPAEQQNRVFAKLQAPFEWKIVLSTNIAESSVTVDDVVHVIDTGFHREMTFDPVASASLLSTVFASKASLTQRCGRAGRVRPGDCWRLFSAEFMESSRLQEYSLPEIKRVPLEDVLLQILILQLGSPRDFLAKCMDPPSGEQVDEALQVLLDIGAITAEERVADMETSDAAAVAKELIYQPYLYRITPLGRHLANIPVDVRLGKMLIYASIFGCLEPALTIVATLSGKSPMVTPPNKRDEANSAHARFCRVYSKRKHPFFVSSSSSSSVSSGEDHADGNKNDAAADSFSLYSPFSDHIAYVRIYEDFMRVHRAHSRGGRRGPEVYNFCKENHLSMKVLDDITALREQFRKYLSNAGFLGASAPPPGAEEGYELCPQLDACDDAPLQESMEDTTAASSRTVNEQKNHTPITVGTNHFATSDAIVRCVICAGLFPRVVRVCKVQSHSSAAKSRQHQQYVQKLFDSSGDTVSIHAASLLSRHTKSLLESDTAMYKEAKDKKKEAFVVYYKKISSPLPNLFDCTEVSPVSLMLFGDSFSNRVKSKRSEVIVNKWIHLGISEDNAVLIRKLRNEIEDILLAKVEGRRSVASSTGQSHSKEYLQKKQHLVTSILEKILGQQCT